MKKCERGEDQFEGLLEQRNTPRQDTGLSPNRMMFGRPTRTLAPTLRKRPKSNRKCEKRKHSVKKYHDKHARDQTQLRVRQNVYLEHKQDERWILGKVLEVQGEKTYII